MLKPRVRELLEVLRLAVGAGGGWGAAMGETVAMVGWSAIGSVCGCCVVREGGGVGSSGVCGCWWLGRVSRPVTLVACEGVLG